MLGRALAHLIPIGFHTIALVMCILVYIPLKTNTIMIVNTTGIDLSVVYANTLAKAGITNTTEIAHMGLQNTSLCDTYTLTMWGYCGEAITNGDSHCVTFDKPRLNFKIDWLIYRESPTILNGTVSVEESDLRLPYSEKNVTTYPTLLPAAIGCMAVNILLWILPLILEVLYVDGGFIYCLHLFRSVFLWASYGLVTTLLSTANEGRGNLNSKLRKAYTGISVGRPHTKQVIGILAGAMVIVLVAIILESWFAAAYEAPERKESEETQHYTYAPTPSPFSRRPAPLPRAAVRAYPPRRNTSTSLAPSTAASVLPPYDGNVLPAYKEEEQV